MSVVRRILACVTSSAEIASLASLVWGKTDDLKRAEDRRGEWLPLAKHLADTAMVADLIFSSIGKLGRRAIGHGLDEDGARRRFVALCAIHDVGKATPAFLAPPDARASPVVSARKSAMEAAGLTFPREIRRRDLRHEAAAMPILLRRFGRAAESAASVVSAHHGFALSKASQNMLRDMVDDEYARELGWDDGLGPWWEVQCEILDDALRSAASVTESTVDQVTAALLAPMPHWAQIAASGAVVRADHIASDEFFFPLSGRRWTLPEMPSLSFDSEPTMASLYADRFGFESPSSLQQELLERVEGMAGPGIVVVESGMGSGKTEAALAAAEVLARKSGASGVALAMPTMATGDAMHRRVSDWVENLPGFDGSMVFLGHSSSALNELHHAARKERSKPELKLARHTDVGHAVSVSTVDQVAKLGARGKSAYLTRARLLGKVVIFDEAHTYDEYTHAFILRTIEHLAAQRSPVIVLSATLSSTRREELVRAYIAAAKLSPFDDEVADPDPINVPASSAYPLVTIAESRMTGVETLEPSSSEASRSVQVEVHEGHDDAFVADLIRQRTPEGGCVGIIRSTVASSQKTARALSREFPDDRLVLLHSRFTVGHRARHLDAILAAAGKDGTERPADGSRVIVVATQVIEESIDVDFDCLITDTAPLDSILQRVGRLHRHDRPERPVGAAHLDVISVREDGGLLLAAEGSHIDYVYSAYQLHVSASWLSSRSELVLPDDIRDAVSVMRSEPDERLVREHQQWLSRELKKRSSAESLTLEPVRFDAAQRFGEHVSAPCNVIDEVADTSMQGGSIRDADGSVEGVLTMLVDGFRETPDGVRTPRQGKVSDEVAREVALASIRLPASRHINPKLFSTPKAWEGRECPPVLRHRLEIPMSPAPHTPSGHLLKVGPLTYSYSEAFGLEKH